MNPLRGLSLKQRLFWSYPLLGAAVAGLLGAVLFVSLEFMERTLMDAHINAELAHFQDRVRRDPGLTEAHARRWHALRLPPGESAPDLPPVGTLPAGVHELEWRGTSYDIGVADGDGQRFYLFFDDSDFETREHDLARLLLAAILISVLAATGLGRLIARRVIEPITTLSAEVERLERDAENGVLPERSPLGITGDDEIGALAARFSRYQARLRGFLLREREFTANASHELRTPLAVIRAATENLLLTDDLPESARTRLLRVAHAADDMTKLLDALLMLAREQAGAHPTGDTDLVPLVTRLIDREQSPERTAEIRLEAHAHPMLDAAEASVTLIVANLLRNAIEHAPGGPITVVVTATELCVQDRGRGLPEARLDAVLKRGERANADDASAHRPGERGLGLAIARHVCTRAGWTLRLRNRAHGGLQACWRFAPGRPESDAK